MGYYTDYEGEVSGFAYDHEVDVFANDLRENSDGYKIELNYLLGDTEGSFSLYGVKWYSHKEDLLKLSRKYPHVLIELNGVGEEAGDYWKMQFLGGEDDYVKGIISYPEFEEITDEVVSKAQEEHRRKDMPKFIRHGSS